MEPQPLQAVGQGRIKMPAAERQPRYLIADLLVDVGRRAVRRGASEIHLSKLSFDALLTLIEAAPDVVSNEDLARAVWHGVVVGPETVTQRIKLLRDALGDRPEAPRYIAGLRGQGYRVVPPVTQDAGAQHAAPPGVASHRAVGWHTLGPALGLTLLLLVVGYLAVERRQLTEPGRMTKAGPAAETSAFAPPPHSIAVLPFVNMSGDAGQEYFSDGLSEELLNDLSRIDGLQVAARTSSFSFKGQETDIRTIARRLNVGAVLEGSIRRSGNSIRITTQLNDAITGFHLWSKTYDRDFGDVLEVQTEIAETVASALRVTLLQDSVSRIEVGGTRNPQAYDAYLRASTGYWRQRSAADLQTVIGHYREAARLDPNFALAYAGWSIAVHLYVESYAGRQSSRELIRQQQEPALRAIALAPDLAEGHAALALFLLHSLDFPRAGEEFERAAALAHGSPRILKLYGEFAVVMGHTDAGLTAVRRAVSLDPLNLNIRLFLIDDLRFARRYADSAAAYADALAIAPDQAELRGVAWPTYYALGDYGKMRSMCEGMQDHECLALAYRKLGRPQDAETQLAESMKSQSEEGACRYAQIYAQWGNNTKALEWLETATRQRLHCLYYLKAEPLFDPLRGERRFQAIERGLGFPD